MYQLLEKRSSAALFIYRLRRVLTVNSDYSLSNINQLIFVMAKRGVLFEVRTEFLILIRASASKG
jgi:hypothetical protein